MIFRFTKLHIHHFLSFDDAEIDLTDKGYCLISGVNKNPKDAARSNGAGKSTICNALSFALIGETISGLKSNLSNNYFNDGCYVELEFFVDNTKYNLLRSKDDKKFGTNLKVYVNNEDRSGKGIRESQAVLDELLPDLTRELIGSVILLGQGLPDKFTANSPSKRKEVLEHLSKSDFMIQDLKKRIESRTISLNQKNRVLDDQLLTLNTEKNLYAKSLESAELELHTLNINIDYDGLINTKKAKLEELTKTVENNTLKLKELEQQESSINTQLLEHTTIKSDRLASVYKQFVEYDKELCNSKVSLQSEANSLLKQIRELQSIKDVCPTCGQKIPGAVKPDTSSQEAMLESINKKITVINNDIEDNKKEYQSIQNKINDEFTQNTSKLKNELTVVSSSKNTYNNNLLNVEINQLSRDIVSLEKDRDSQADKIIQCKLKIEDIKKKIEENEKSISRLEADKSELKEHLEINSKMNTFIKRDFRGILLKNSIDYINLKAKEYSSKIFNTDDVEFNLDGNNISITFCSKDYENLSGGEKQRMDLITQFAIRDMLSTQVGFSSNILFLDEITDNLDRDSCDKVIDFITNNFKDIESMFIISHHADLDIPVDSEIIVYKDMMGVSRI